MNYELVKRILTSLVLLPILIYCSYNSGFYFIIFLSTIYFFSFYEIFKNTKNFLFNFISNIIIIFALFSFYYLRGETSSSLTLLYWILLSTFLSDIGGYTFGKIFKGPKLTKISPKKTITGAFGSLIFSMVLMSGSIFYFTKNFSYLILILALLTSISCQLGDLFFSFLKRKAKIKDTGSFLPGHGGILDRIDGILFGVPVGLISLTLLF